MVCLAKKSDDVYQDYVDIVIGLTYDATTIKWRLKSSATSAEYQTWESDMELGFARCRTLDYRFGGRTEYIIAHRCVDVKVARWWEDARYVYGVIGKTFHWEDFKHFLRSMFLKNYIWHIPEIFGVDVDETCEVSTNVIMSTPSVVSCDVQVAFEERELPILQPASPICALSLEEHVIDIGTDLELQPATENLCESTHLLVTSCDLSCSNVSEPCDNLLNSNFDHVVLMTHKEVLSRIPPTDIVYSIMLTEPISLSCAMKKVSEISYLNSSTYAYCFTFNLIGEYSMSDNFMVDHICITCDRIAEQKLAVFHHICNVSKCFCYGTRAHFRDNMISYDLLDILHPTNLVQPMLVCSDFA